MEQAKRETTDLGRKMTETGASADRMRRRLEAATKALPKIEIDADSSPAEIKFAELRKQLESLADKKVGIDINADAARAELAQIERELEQLQRNEANINVRADIGTALAELRAIDGEVSKVDGRTASVNVNADVGGALAGIAMVGAALAALPAVTTVAVGVTALGSAFAAAGLGAAGFAAVAVPSLTRINDALKAQETAAKGAGGATGGAGQSAAQAAIQALQLEQAEKRLADAQKDERQAQEDLTRAREAGRRALEDMNFSLERSILSQKDASLAVREAEARLAELQADPDASALDVERAMLSVEQAHQRAREQEVKTQRAKKDTTAANKAGVQGTKEYQRGLDDLEQAQDKVAQAEMQLKQLHLQQKAAMSSAGGGGGAGGLTDAFAKLSKQEKVLAEDIKHFKDAYLDWQRSVQPDVLPVISQGLGLMEKTLPKLTPLVKSASGAFSILLDDAEKALAGDFWNTFLFNVNTYMPEAIIGLGRSFGNIVTGIAGIMDAFLPFTPTIVGGVEGATKAFSEWGQQLKDSPEFAEFIAFVKENAPKVWELIKNIASAGKNIVEALAPLGVGSLAGLNLLAEIVAGMDPEHIQAIALGLIAIKTAHAGLSAVSHWKNLAENVGLVGNAATGAKGKVASLVKVAAGVGVALGALAGADALARDLSGADVEVDKLVDDLDKLGKTGAFSGDLLNQWQGVFDGAEDAPRKLADAIREINDPTIWEWTVAHPIDWMADQLPFMSGNFQMMSERVGLVDQALAQMVSGGNAAGAQAAFQRIAEEAGKSGTKVDDLKKLFPEYASAVAGAKQPTTDTATAIDQAKQKMDGLQSSLDTFAGRTDALQAIRNMETAYKDAATAIEASNGKLDFNAQMTDKQRDAVILAREAFGGYLEKVDTGAQAQEKLTGRTGDATIKVAEQLPKLMELAGKSSEAKEQVYALAEKFGISREMADKAATGSKNFKDELAKLKDKQVKIELDTKAALDKAYAFAKQLLGIKLELPIGIRAPAAPRAYGGIYNTDGRQYMASGGIRSLGSNPAAMIASSPYMISGRSGPDVVFGEAGMEAYIPLSSGKRDRGLQILQEAAGIMGMAVVPEHIGVNTAGGSTTGGGGVPMPGAASVTVTGIDALRSSLDMTALGLTGSLGAATSTLDAALGEAGTLTGAVDGLGEAAIGWGEVIAVQVPPLTDAVTLLGEAISAAASAADAKGDAGSKGDERSPRGGSSSKGSTGSKGDERSPRGGTALSAVRSTQALKQPPPTEIKGAARGTAGVALPGGSTNWSRVSRPVQSSSWAPSGPSQAPAAQPGSGGSSGGASGGGPLVALNGMTVRSEADIDQFAAQVAMRISGRG
ncbi:hypothetical protein OG884_18860 [Streptosporangium sp. NBC_01755]|uniref:hypothetical protein n=1 Tax=Streptosporangium sp. NBC_01755 TaxID=2975949 RepID=UPI002DD7F178|nr:hypothetical protein [Streptosporangium sp. NBC_01755]WSD03870.1 hypothetical protein OG884_18860 [Streptosporangium sp. NBC_01755]